MAKTLKEKEIKDASADGTDVTGKLVTAQPHERATGYEYAVNKVAISTSFPALLGFLNNVVESTNKRCFTLHDTSETGSFLAANLYAKSEDALVHVSVEKKDDNDGKFAGYIRIRFKTQGVPLSLQRSMLEAK